ncbi:hypothetical protein KP001_07960 [Geomonas subterranea]|uniref:Small secreted protein n=1 Tax=Geomonas subterranea TaxID=2847989 RepID=A0ABX8LNF2_9BACT|nr:hypothetical protein [Geomonas subterranea]QXE92446.1 hypothetical protein KP001_07960 [Geomonas subterranea]QXM09455.1 hypothetical protein KP002_21310 [Geomonas subterranea]
MDDLILYGLCGVVVLAVMGAFLTKSPKAAFAKMGPVAGKTKAEIFAKAGPPNSVSAAPDGKTVYQWFEISHLGNDAYHIALIFNGDICEGITHEFRS